MAKEFRIVVHADEDFSYEKHLEPIHDILAGSQDYIDSNIVYNIDDIPTIHLFPSEFVAKLDTYERLDLVLRVICAFFTK